MIHIDDLLRLLVEREASDLHLRVGEPPVMRIHGNLVRLDMPCLTDRDMYDLVHPVMNPEREVRFEQTMELDLSYAVPGLSRFRVNIFRQRGSYAIVMLGDMQDQPRLLDDLRNTSVPVVATWQGTSPLEFPTVDVDERAGIIAGLEHLLALGHERIGFVSSRLPGDNWQRQDAFVEFMGARFGGVPDGYVQRVDNSLAGGETAIRSLLELADPPTAVVTSTDLVAVGVLHAAYSLGHTVPDALSVVGFDDLLLAAHTVPALTTLRMPIAEIVRQSVELAIGLARDVTLSREPRVTVFEPTLVVRQSTAPPSVSPAAARLRTATAG
jgi:DNA-binding LacI/PurR family transcriptional regulator